VSETRLTCHSLGWPNKSNDSQFIFAGMHVIAKPALHYIPPFALAMMRVRGWPKWFNLIGLIDWLVGWLTEQSGPSNPPTDWFDWIG
jgi:hypothetical protein